MEIRTVGDEIVRGLTEFADTLERGDTVKVTVIGTTAVRPEDMTAEQRRRWAALTEAARAEYARTRNSEELP